LSLSQAVPLKARIAIITNKRFIFDFISWFLSIGFHPSPLFSRAISERADHLQGEVTF
jgi:hypothetical protein